MKIRKFEGFKNNVYKLGSPIKISDVNPELLSNILDKIEDSFVIFEDDFKIQLEFVEFGVIDENFNLKTINPSAELTNSAIDGYTNLYVDILLVGIDKLEKNTLWDDFLNTEFMIGISTELKKLSKSLFNSNLSYIKITPPKKIVFSIIIPNE